MKNLKALLIGINDYPSKPLSQCVNDVIKMETYLNSIANQFETTKIEKLLDDEATKDNVIEAIQMICEDAQDEDTILIYYSGHGAQEESNGLFEDEHDGLLECMVCYDKKRISTECLLADKEIRFLLGLTENNPHLITVFDSCHSGDMVRAYHEEAKDESVKRIAGSFPPRKENEFIFSPDDFKNKNGKIFFSYKNHIHLAACLSSESSYEDKKGGIFTTYLLGFLKASDNQISYLDLSRWAKISLKESKTNKQTPIIKIQGKGKLNAYSSWLNIHPDLKSLPQAHILWNGNEWIYTRGELLGVQNGMEVEIEGKDGHKFQAKIKKVDANEAYLEISSDVSTKLNPIHRYSAKTIQTSFSKLAVSINNIDFDEVTEQEIKTIVSNNENVELSENSTGDFQINIFNNTIYFSFPDEDFQPLSTRFIINDVKIALKNYLNDLLPFFIKWNHFNQLENPGRDFEVTPIKVEVQAEGSDEIVNITNSKIDFKAESQRSGKGFFYKRFKVKVTNISRETLYIGALLLYTDLSFDTEPFDHNVIELAPGKSRIFYKDSKREMAFIRMEKDQEIYNWKREFYHIKFIYNNYEDFTEVLKGRDFQQTAIGGPLIINDDKELLTTRGGGNGDKLEPVQKKWGTSKSTVQLFNPEFNIVSGDLKRKWQVYEENEILMPFIKELYFEQVFNGTSFELQLKQNTNESGEFATKANHTFLVTSMNRIYNLIRRRKFEKQKHRSGPIIVAEGDSWFLFPKPGVKDTLDYIMDEYRLLSLADAGDEFSDYIENNELISKVKKLKPEIVLISGGGNDVIGEKIVDILKSNVPKDSPFIDYLKSTLFQTKIDVLKNNYMLFFELIHDKSPNSKIFIHGYDYIRSKPDPRTIEKGWANKYMIEKGIYKKEKRAEIIHYLVDTFNEMLVGLVENDKYKPYVRYVENLNTVNVNEWRDEIHPNNVGYKKVANNFLEVIKANA